VKRRTQPERNGSKQQSITIKSSTKVPAASAD
jgi:hypothetical protein